MAAGFRAVVSAASTPNRSLLRVRRFKTSWRHDACRWCRRRRRNRSRRRSLAPADSVVVVVVVVTVSENGAGFWCEERNAVGKVECAKGADVDDDDSAAAGPVVEAVLGDRRRDGGGAGSAAGESKGEKTETEPSSSSRRERKTTTGEDSHLDDDPRIEVYEIGEDTDDVDDDDPKIEVCESDGDEEGGSAATASRMPLLPTTVASDDGFDGCDRKRRERWRRRVRRAIAAAI